jgi:hypothetical protein
MEVNMAVKSSKTKDLGRRPDGRCISRGRGGHTGPTGPGPGIGGIDGRGIIKGIEDTEV